MYENIKNISAVQRMLCSNWGITQLYIRLSAKFMFLMMLLKESLLS